MPKRAADDFTTIRARLAELTAVPRPKRSASGAVGYHCDHCPKEPNEHCPLGCEIEAKAAGVVE